MTALVMNSVAMVDRWLHQGDAAVAGRVAFATRSGDAWVELTYGDLAHRSSGVAAALAGAGVEPGDRVALFGESGGDWAAGFLGILRRGAVAVPLDMKVTADELASLCQRSGLAAALVSSAQASRWVRPVPVLDLSAPLVGDGHVGHEERSLDDPAAIVWTSGTTGRPKGVTLSFANIGYVVEQASAIQGAGPSTRWLSVLAPNHLLELCCGMLPALAASSTTFVARTVVPHELGAMTADCRVNRMVVVPMILRLLERHLECEARAGHRPDPVTGGHGFSLPRVFHCGGAPLARDVVEFFDGLGARVLEGYGLSEAASAVTMNSPRSSRAGSVGQPLPGTDVRTLDDHEILVRGPGVMLGYWRDEAATTTVIDEHGWLHTGDLGHVDDDGFVFVTGRAKNLIVLDSGKNVQPEEVEAAICRSELFTEVCVVGLPGVDGHGEKVCAVVVPAMPTSREVVEEEIRRLTSGLSGFKRPTVVHVNHGELPKTVKRSIRRADVVKLLEEVETRP